MKKPNFFYKMLRNKIYGTIGKRELSAHEAKIFKFPMYNRAFSSMVAGVFRDRIARYEQKYVNSEYGLVLIQLLNVASLVQIIFLNYLL